MPPHIKAFQYYQNSIELLSYRIHRSRPTGGLTFVPSMFIRVSIPTASVSNKKIRSRFRALNIHLLCNY